MENLEEKILDLLSREGSTLSSAESCTGGKIADFLTNIPGISRFFRGGIVAYSAEVKIAQLAVPAEIISKFGVVSEPCARAMAQGCARLFASDFAISSTGVAGPGPQDGLPAGTVCIGIYIRGKIYSRTLHLENLSREEVKHRASRRALAELLSLASPI